MALRIHCDRCGAFVKNMSINEARDMGKEIICKKCQDAETNLLKTLERLKNQWQVKFNLMITEAKDQLAAEIKTIVEERMKESE